MFDDIVLSWKGETKKVKANSVLKLIAVIEDHVTYFDLCGKPPLAKCATAYAAALTFAGFENVTAGEIYSDIFRGQSDAVGAISGLLRIMIPPAALLDSGGDDEKKNQQPGN